MKQIALWLTLAVITAGCSTIPSDKETSEYQLIWDQGRWIEVTLEPWTGEKPISLELWNEGRFLTHFQITEITDGELRGAVKRTFKFGAKPFVKVLLYTKTYVHEFEIGEPLVDKSVDGIKYPARKLAKE